MKDITTADLLSKYIKDLEANASMFGVELTDGDYQVETPDRIIQLSQFIKDKRASIIIKEIATEIKEDYFPNWEEYSRIEPTEEDLALIERGLSPEYPYSIVYENQERLIGMVKTLKETFEKVKKEDII